MAITQERTHAGQAIYTKPTLNLYDLVVLGVSNRWIWKCCTPWQLEHYDRHIRGNHLDIGVGTGYYLDKCRFLSPAPRIALMDLNPHSLAHAAQRIARYQPSTHVRNILEPIAWEEAKFDSIGLNYLFHCLPGSMAEKAVVFDRIQPLMAPGAVVFGATLLQGPEIPRSFLARRLMALYNKKGVFTNTDDTLPALGEALDSRFREVSLEVVGCCALFSGRIPRT
ncbi:MAG: class I SAM-dependent methyltransferase [Fibrobacteres bacterium]|nr:class I SAM-dependent methyltransferase [Fibrobacterota bacterium]